MNRRGHDKSAPTTLLSFNQWLRAGHPLAPTRRALDASASNATRSGKS
jgi:hypothetical protein